MENIVLIYNICVMIIACILFFMKIKSASQAMTFILTILAKAMTIFCIFYSGIQIFKHFGVI